MLRMLYMAFALLVYVVAALDVGRGNSSNPAATTATAMLKYSNRSRLPTGPLIIGYQNWAACNLKTTLSSVKQGLNVVIWFATNLAKNETTQQPQVQSGPNYTCVAEVRTRIEMEYPDVVHLISIGGWDAPHPDTSWNGSEWFRIWNDWNQGLPKPFDGIDWDLEGNDNISSTYNEFTPAVLDLVIDMSTAAKKAGYIVTLVPAQSYFDVTTSKFDRSLLNAYTDFHPDFTYHGRNCYSYFLVAAPPGTFDLVSVQLYESWSRADQALIQKQELPENYLQAWAAAILDGWFVDFDDPDLRVSGKQLVKLKPEQLIVALSFGSADGSGKSAFFWPQAAAKAYSNANPGHQPRGYAFWEIQMDGVASANGTNVTVNFAKGLNNFLHVRHELPASIDVVV